MAERRKNRSGSGRIRRGDPDQIGACAGRVHIGRWAEKWVGSHLPGSRDWPDSLPYTVPHIQDAINPKEAYSFYPDLWWPAHRALVEVKAGIRRYYVTRRQLLGYQYLLDSSPIQGIRVYYAFVPYQLQKKMVKYSLTRLEGEFSASMGGPPTLLDLGLVSKLAEESGFWGKDTVTPLSHLLGAWEDYARITPTKLQAFLGGLSPVSLEPRLYSEGPLPDPWVGPIPGEQAPLFQPDPIW